MKKMFSLLFIALLLGGCSHFPYQTEVEQGHRLTQAQINQLKLGMSKTQVNYLLGSPDMKNIYNENIWYYVYTSSYSNAAPMHLQLTFKEEKLIAINGHYIGFPANSSQPTP